MKPPFARLFFRAAPRRAAFAGVLAFVVFFSLWPREAVDAAFSPEVQSFDWLFHSGCHAALAALALAAFQPRPAPGAPLSARLLPRLDAALACAALGCALELGQALLPFVQRSCSRSDAVANALGALAGALLFPRALLLPPPGDRSRAKNALDLRGAV